MSSSGPTGDERESSRGQARRKPAAPDVAALSPGLYLVATPIGNARDITLRALDVLAAADVIACEDTRVTAKLLAIHGIATPTTVYHEHNARRAGPALIARIAGGQAVALVSDAGTPLVSDPGYRLVQAAIAADLAVVPIPGPSSVLAALTVAGLPTDRFLFAGFLPPKPTARRRALAGLAALPATLVFLETAPRLAASLADMAAQLGDRPAVVARELTKFYEEVRRGSLCELAAHYAEAGAPKGEIVVLVGPPAQETASDAEVDRALTEALDNMSVKDAAATVAAMTGWPRREVYRRALDLSEKR